MDDKKLAEVNRRFHAEKKKNEAALAARREEVYLAVPQIKAMDDTLWASGLSMMQAVWAGESPEDVAASYATRANDMKEKKRHLLMEAGFTPDYLEMKYTCPHCKDTGLFEGRLCSCYLKLMAEELYRESNMGQLLRTQTFAKFRTDLYEDSPVEGKMLTPRKNMHTILGVCKKFADTFRMHHDSLIFYGNPGLGKTFLSSAIANELLDKGISVLYQSAGQVFDVLGDARFGRGDSETNQFLKAQLLEVELLIIDDLGTEFINGMTEADLFYVVNSRILAEKSTIISTNMHLKDLSRQYSDRLLSRILGHYTPLHFYGKDIRSMG